VVVAAETPRRACLFRASDTSGGGALAMDGDVCDEGFAVAQCAVTRVWWPGRRSAAPARLYEAPRCVTLEGWEMTGLHQFVRPWCQLPAY
jgi:hypothetical protein